MSDNIARILALAAIGAGGGGGGGGALTPIVVYELPDVGEEGVLYLVPRQVTETKNVFDEYIYVNGGWEKIGSTDIDFSDYYTKQEVDTIAATLNTSIGQRYLKPSGGIPDTDLSSGVQSDLNKAKTALQTESDPVFSASVAAGITSSNITSWNNKLSSESDPVFSASPAAGITSANITNWSGKQDALVSGTNIKTINNTSLLGSGNLSTKKQSLIVDAAQENLNYIIDAEDVDIILGKVENQEDFDLFIRVQAGEDTYTTPAHIDVYSTSGNDYIQLVCDTITSAWTRWSTYYGELIEGSDCTLVEHRIENANNKVTSIMGSESYAAYPTTVAVTDFVNSKFLSKTNTNSYTPTSNYHPATKKYVDDSVSGIDLSNYLAKNNTATFNPTGNYNPATKKYVDDAIAGIGGDAPLIIDATAYTINSFPGKGEESLKIENSGTCAQLDSLLRDIYALKNRGINVFFKVKDGNDDIYLPMLLTGIDGSMTALNFALIWRWNIYTLYGVNTSGVNKWEIMYGNTCGIETITNKVRSLSSLTSEEARDSYPTAQAVIDSISKYQTMPLDLGALAVGRIAQYIGNTTSTYTKGYFYQWVWQNGAGHWERIDVQPSSGSEYEFFDGTEEEWNALTQEQQKSILFAAVDDFELTSEEETILLGVLGDKTGIDADTELEETLNAFLNIAGENE